MASALLREHIQEKLNEVAHMLILDKGELAKNFLNHGLIQDVSAEKLVAGALEQAFVEFVRILTHILLYYLFQLFLIQHSVIYLIFCEFDQLLIVTLANSLSTIAMQKIFTFYFSKTLLNFGSSKNIKLFILIYPSG